MWSLAKLHTIIFPNASDIIGSWLLSVISKTEGIKAEASRLYSTKMRKMKLMTITKLAHTAMQSLRVCYAHTNLFYTIRYHT